MLFLSFVLALFCVSSSLSERVLRWRSLPSSTKSKWGSAHASRQRARMNHSRPWNPWAVTTRRATSRKLGAAQPLSDSDPPAYPGFRLIRVFGPIAEPSESPGQEVHIPSICRRCRPGGGGVAAPSVVEQAPGCGPGRHPQRYWAAGGLARRADFVPARP